MADRDLMDAPEETNVIKLIEEWGKEKGILDKSDPYRQFDKMKEEVDEFAVELANPESSLEAKELELGDIVVTAILEARLLGTDLEACMWKAYNKISKRTGKMVDGQFVKDGD